MLLATVALAANFQCSDRRCYGTALNDINYERGGNGVGDTIYGLGGDDRINASSFGATSTTSSVELATIGWSPGTATDVTYSWDIEASTAASVAQATPTETARSLTAWCNRFSRLLTVRARRSYLPRNCPRRKGQRLPRRS